MAVRIGKLGVWRGWPELADSGAAGEIAADLEAAGYDALWLGRAEADLALAGPVLAATSRLVFATGILNVWTEPAERVNEAFAATPHTDRLLLGVGAGHPEANSGYTRPYAAVRDYLDRLDVPAQNLALAALGPKVLRLAGERTAGAHPYLVTPEHTRFARDTLGDGPLLAPEQKVVLDEHADTARTTARQGIAVYLKLANYRANLLRLGFTEDDLADGGSDRLVDALVAWGSVETVGRRIAEHHAAGADHVSVQVLSAGTTTPVDSYREVAQVVTG